MPFPQNLILILKNGLKKIEPTRKLLILTLINGMMNGILKEIMRND
jgi:hypothetical protein